MQNLVLSIAGRTLFSTELGDDVLDEIQRCVPICWTTCWSGPFRRRFVERLPIPGNRRFDEAAARACAK